MDLRRGIEPSVLARLERHKVVVLEGARAVGKTTLVRKIAADLGGSYLDLSEQSIRAAVEANPDAVLAGLARPVVIDEAQLVNSLPLDIKRVVDADPSPGQFLLTGSSRLSRGALGGSDPLAGRATRLTLHPLTVAERLGAPHNRVEQWLSESPTATTSAQIEHEALLRHITQGGLPGQATAQPPESNAEEWWQFAAETMPTYLDSALSLLYGKYDADRNRLAQAIRYLAANPAQILNIARMANELTISRDTARRYVELLTDSLLLHRLPGVRPTAHKTLTAHPKIAVFDTAFAAWAAGVNPNRLIFDARVWGGLIENLTALEIAAQTSWTGPGITLGHWRQGTEKVDLVITNLDGSVIAIEVKAAKTVTPRDAKGLRALQRQLGERFRQGHIIYTGPGRYPLDDQLWATPLTDLWT